MKKLGLLLITVALTVGSVNAQYVFKVLAAKGTNQVFTNGAWSNIIAGSKVNKGEKIKVTTGAYVGLIHPTSGKTIELKTAGTFNVADLEAKIVSGKADFGTKYANYVQDGMFSSNTGASNSYDRTGTVTREVAATTIFLYAPKEMTALKSDALKLHWNSCGGKHKFRVTLSDYFGQEVYSKDVDTNCISVDFKDIKVNDSEMDASLQSSFLIKIVSLTNSMYTTVENTSAGKNNNNYTINWLDDATAKAKTADINSIKAEMDKTSAMDYLVLAMAYEKAGLTTYAVDSYAKANQLAPGVEDFKTQYEEYIKTKLGKSSLNGSKGN
jgi:hypothetical protein